MKAGLLVAAVLVAAMLRTDSHDRHCPEIVMPHILQPGGELFDAHYKTPVAWPELHDAQSESFDQAMNQQGWVLMTKVYDIGVYYQASCLERSF